MNASSYAPSPEAFLSAYLSDRYGLEIERPWALQQPPAAPPVDLPAVPDLLVPAVPEG